ncbi:Phage tail assembly [Lactococcus lactis subsp. lactis Dephy 1]|nr:Phage tail assembly [Lactococcus lactis subsp. lactis Dephy 1]
MPLHIGDTVRIQDKNFIDSDGNVGLFLSARVSELEISFTNPTSNKIMFSNYIKLKSEVSDDLTARMQEIIDANTPYRSELSTTNGTQFKNGVGTTKLGAHIYFGSDDKETIADSYSWTKDGTVVANVQEITVDASGVSEKAVFSYQATVAGKVVANQSVTITNVDDGTNGRSVTNVSQKWRLTTTTATPTQAWSDAGWLTTQPTTTATNKYLWSITRTTFNLAPLTQDVIEQKAVYGDKGDKGDKGIQGIQGVDGRQGIPGPKGADGKTQYTHIAYANSADGVTDFSTSDSNRTYIGMYVDFNINDSTTPSDYSWTLVKGADGTQGTPGKPGADGKTPYFHTAWSYSVDGTDGFTTIYPNLNLWKNTKSQSITSTGTGRNVLANVYKLDGSTSDVIGKTVTITYDFAITNSTGTWSGTINPTLGFAGSSNPVSNTSLSGSVKQIVSITSLTGNSYSIAVIGLPAGTKVTITNLKVEIGSTATPYMPSSSEVTTADWPSYIGQYTDFTQADSTNPSDYTWSLIRGNDGKNGATGPKGPPGSNGAPGKVVSNTEPSTRFKGLTWKYSGTVDLTASDGTVIKPNTEYYYNGTHWMINFLSANNIDANSITAEKINGTDLEVKNGKFTDGVIETSWKNGTVAGSTNIEKDHLIITRTDSSVNTTNSIGLDSTQGLIMVYTENSTGRTISVGTNFQGMSLTDSKGFSASISPAGVKLSSDVDWTQIGNIGGRRAEWKRENNRVTMNIHGGNGDRFPVVTSGGTFLGILPTNARPPSDISMPATAQAAGATAQISINSSGEVRCYRWGGDSIYFSAYISYYVE